MGMFIPPQALLGLTNTWSGQNTFAQGTLTTSQPMTLTQTWNDAGVTFNGLSVDITSTASAAASLPFRVRVGGTNIFAVQKDGTVTANAVTNGNANTALRDGRIVVGSASYFAFTSSANAFTTEDVFLYRDAANTLAQRNGTAAQVTRGYRTWTDASNYERWALQSGAGYFELAAETAGTGTDNVDVRLTPAGTGIVSSAFAIKSTSATAGMGYATGAGGTVTQATSRSTGVTLDKVTGQITTTADSLAANTIVTFTVTSSAVAATDAIILSKVSGDADTSCFVSAVASGSFNVSLRNNDAAGADVTAFVFNFAVIKGVTS